MAADKSKQLPGFLLSNYPVSFPSHNALFLSELQFRDFLTHDLTVKQKSESTGQNDSVASNSSLDAKASTPSYTSVLRDSLENLSVEDVTKLDQNTMLTENTDVAHRSTTSPLVDLFTELEEVVSGPRLREILEAAWNEDPLSTLKIIFNARSIHIGKSSRSTFYRCAGWLAHEHPHSLLTNLRWLSRPIIEKKLAKKEDDEDELVLVEAEKEETDPSRFDVKHGVAHGYYKDLLNILVLAVNDKLDVLANPRDVLNFTDQTKPKEKVWNAKEARDKRHAKREAQHDAAMTKFQNNAFYRGLHITIARLFASQLSTDLALLSSADPKKKRQISLCAKWAPSHRLFHDKHTLIVSSVAEILHPQSEYRNISDRETYLRHAREAYRKDVVALRKALEIVERNISAETFQNIKYNKVPSLAMDRYVGLFAKKDTERFDKYIENVAQGKQAISGAVLLPSTLIHRVRRPEDFLHNARGKRKVKTIKTLANQKVEKINRQTIDGQWKTLVQRIRDSGTLSSSIAVCDVSASMNGPLFPDGTTPMDSAIGLSLIIAEVTAPPFGGQFITFSTIPQLQKIDPSAALHEKVRGMETSRWNMSTNFVAVFEKLLLPEAKRQKLKPEDMVKTIFVFSDMQFDAAAEYSPDTWSSSFERVKKKFEKSGYEMPQLVFWNLAGGRAGYGSSGRDDPVAPKPVLADEPGAALVSGYSQGLLKVFLDNGGFEDPEEAIEEEIKEVDEIDEDGDEQVVIEKRKKIKMDPLITVKKAISHKAYDMLAVFD